MFTIGKNLTIQQEDATVFGGLQLQIREAGGEWAAQELAQALDKAGRATFTATDEISQSELDIICGADVLAVSTRVSLKAKFPNFTRQRYFAREEAVKLVLPMEATPMLAIYQHKDWWCRPAFPAAPGEVPTRTQLLIWQQNGQYMALLACCGESYRSDVQGTAGGLEVVLSSNSDMLDRCEDTLFVLATGPDPYACCERAAQMVLRLTGRTEGMLRKNKQYPSVFEVLGWCSWDAFYHKVSTGGILDKLAELQEKQVPVKWVLIDDGWSEANYESQQLTGLDARQSQFPGGLGEAVRKIKETGIYKVGVWHAMMGYWNGVEENSPAHKALTPYLTQLPDGRLVPSTRLGDAFALWNTWHSHLRRQGIDFVKVDGQSAVSLYHWGATTYGAASTQAHAGLEGSTQLNFAGNLINCMGMAPETVWNRPASSITRSSDDFVPDTAGGFREHALQNAYNSIWQGLFYWCDWDMFWSDHAENKRNSMLRAVSGGPVYVSDKVGETQPAWVLPLVWNDGTLLRCDSIGMPTLDCLLQDPTASQRPLKVFNRYGYAYLVSAFNLQEEGAVKDTLHPNQLAGAEEGEWLVQDWETGSVTLLQKGSGLEYHLCAGECKIYQLVPVRPGLTALGLRDKYLSVAAITRWLDKAGQSTFILRQAGEFRFYCPHPVTSVEIDGEQSEAKLVEPCVYSIVCEGDEPFVTIHYAAAVQN